ncbi:MAG: hypothetical protein LBM75_11760 [Myxococcales bacterium]|jgi:hypothetical protein|nr:hypothetical protein [Myxococcales bacterium]
MNKTMPWKFLMVAICSLLTLGLGLTACGGSNESTEPPDANEPVGPGGETGFLRVALIDELTSRPVLGATVVANVAGASHTFDQQADGRYEAELTSKAAATISVFHDDYDFVTVAGVQQGSDIVVSLNRLPTSRRGGITGEFTNWPVDADTLAVGIAGLSLQGNILDFSPTLYLGDQERATFTLPEWLSNIGAMLPSDLLPPDIGELLTGSFELDVPGSAMLGDKTTYAVLGLPSRCNDEVAERAGACGTQAAFSAYIQATNLMEAFGMISPLLSQELIATLSPIMAGGELNIPELIPVALPLLPKLLSLISYDYASNLSLTFGDENHALVQHDFSFSPAKKFELKRSVTIPALPVLMGDESADLVGVIALADLQSQGLLPLGAGVSDGSQLTFDMTLADVGNGLDEAGRKLVAIALDSDIAGALTDSSTPIVFSALIGSFERLSATGTDMQGSFLTPPSGSAFDGAQRTLSQLPAVEGATLYRAELKGADRRWLVYYGNGSASVTLPSVPTGFSDVLLADQDHTLIAVRLPSAVTFQSLFEDDAANADQLGNLMEAFSISIH